MADFVDFESAYKFEGGSASRTCSPVTAVHRAKSALDIESVNLGGISRVDPYGVPVYVVESGKGLGGTVYYKGKGFTDTESLASGLMETVERESAASFEGLVFNGSYEELDKCDESVVDPAQLGALVLKGWSPMTGIPWALGRDLLRRCDCYAPLNLVVMPYHGTEFFRSNSVGLGAGLTYEEACAHALFEIIEHDALAMANLFNPNSWRLLYEPDSECSAAPARGVVRDTTPGMFFPLIRLESFPENALTVANALLNSGLWIYVRNITNDIGVPAVSCILAEPAGDGAIRSYYGYGAHTDPGIALIRALCEAAQSHSVLLWMVQNGIEKPPPVIREDPEILYGYGKISDFSEMPGHHFSSIREEIEFLLQRFQACGLPQILVFNLTKPHIGIPVVRVIVAGAEYLVMEPWDQRLGHRGEMLLNFRRNVYLELVQKG